MEFGRWTLEIILVNSIVYRPNFIVRKLFYSQSLPDFKRIVRQIIQCS